MINPYIIHIRLKLILDNYKTLFSTKAFNVIKLNIIVNVKNLIYSSIINKVKIKIIILL